MMRGGNAADGFPLEQAFVACIQDNGVDSELLPNGVVSSDKNDTLSPEEWRDLADLCDQRLEDEGFVVHEEPSDETTERAYNAWVDFRKCMVDQGIALGELISLESYAANPAFVGELLSAAVREDLVAFSAAHARCPSRNGFVSINVVPE